MKFINDLRTIQYLDILMIPKSTDNKLDKSLF